MSVFTYDKLKAHVGHKIVVAQYGEVNVSIQCVTCSEVLLDFDRVDMSRHDAWLDEATKLGAEAGEAAGSWIFNGNTKNDYIVKVLKGYTNGDPEILDMQPSPLSGEWADSRTPKSLFEEVTGLGAHAEASFSPEAYGWVSGEICSAFETAFGEAFWTEVVRSGLAILPNQEDI